MSVKAFSSLRVRFALITARVVAVFVLLFFLVLDAQRSWLEHRELQRRLSDLLAVQSASLAGPLWTLNDRQVALTVDAIAIDPSVALVVVTGDNGERIAQAFDPDEPSIAYEDSVPIVYETGAGPRAVGHLTIALTNEPIRVARFWRLATLLPLALLLVAGVIAGSIFAFRATVGRPLTRLLDGIEAAGHVRRQRPWDI